MGKKNYQKDFNGKKRSFADRARNLGISPGALRQRIKNEKEEKAAREAGNALAPKSAGWNNRAGAKKKHRPENE